VEQEIARILAIHGAIVLLLGILAGLPFWLVILGSRKKDIRPWQVAHATLIAVGLMLLVVAVIAPHLTLNDVLRGWLTGSLVASGYGFSFALIVGAAVGNRGLDPRPVGINTWFFLGHLIGAIGSVVGGTILLLGLLA
jgi:hypothetical protein